MRREPTLTWLALGFLAVLLANALASVTTRTNFAVMGAVSDFALTVRTYELKLIPYYNVIAFPGISAIALAYIWPIIVYFRRGPGDIAPPTVQRRSINAPSVLAATGFAPWFFGCLLFPALTIYRFGRWSPDLMSQQVLSPLVNGFLAATTSYLLLDSIFRTRVVPLVFPAGRLAETSGAVALSVRARLLVFLVAVAFIPLFTMLGLVRSAAVRAESGMAAEAVIQDLAQASTVTFAIYAALGIGLTLLLARSLTRPLSEMSVALRRVQAGDLQGEVQVCASDEVGVLQDGVNSMVMALREKERILQTFGRVVEPSIRDRLLSGNLRLGGELRMASVLFCDLHGFTALAERTSPTEVVATLNEFFTVMTSWVRECGGFVDKFIGDAMLVVFGLFDTDASGADSAAAAVRCALGVRERLAELNSARSAAGQSPLALSVAIHTGEVLAGRIGAEDRHDYTVIGDTVNVAARLQEVSKDLGYDMLVSETAYELARSCGCAPDAKMRDSVALRGRNEPVRVLGIA